MLEQDAYEAIMRHWKAGWEALRPTVAWTQTGEVFDALDEWVRVTVSTPIARLATLGSNPRRERRGVIGVQIFTLPANGPRRASALADDARAVLETAVIASLTGDGEPVLVRAGASQPPQTDGKWLAQLVTFEYRYDDMGTRPPDPPVSDFSFAANFLAVAFADESSRAVSWAWTFGDGGSSTEQNPSHVYEADGDYTVTLQVTDDRGRVATTEQTVTVAA